MSDLAALNLSLVGRYMATEHGWALWPVLRWAAEWQLEHGWRDVRARMLYLHGQR